MNQMLTELFNSQARALILTRLFTPDTPKYHLRQLARDGGLSAPGILKELTHLHELKLVRKENFQYWADQTSELFPLLCELVDKAEGLHGKIRRMLSPLPCECVFIYGSEANGTARPDSDLDLFIVGSCSLLEVSEALLPAADLTNREVNPFLLTPEDFRQKCQCGDHFVHAVLNAPKIFLRGGRHELARLGG